MKILKFKSNIKCSGCVANITPHMNAETGISKWEVDINSPEKTLTVETETLDEKEIENLVKKAGYKAESL